MLCAIGCFGGSQAPRLRADEGRFGRALAMTGCEQQIRWRAIDAFFRNERLPERRPSLLARRPCLAKVSPEREGFDHEIVTGHAILRFAIFNKRLF